jgi:hypothetical protein
MPVAPGQGASAFLDNLDLMRFGLHIKFGYGIVLLEILRNTLVLKSGETRSFVFVLDNFTELLIKLSVKYV